MKKSVTLSRLSYLTVGSKPTRLGLSNRKVNCDLTKEKDDLCWPLVDKAKNRFENEMDLLHSCVVEQEDDMFMFLSSISGRYHFWMKKESDENWKIVK